MEDSHLIHHDFAVPTETQWPSKNSDPEVRRLHLFSIFDGHGGSQVAKFAAVALIDELDHTLQFHEGDFEIAFKVAYCNIDRILRSHNWFDLRPGFMAIQGRDHNVEETWHQCQCCKCFVPCSTPVSEFHTPLFVNKSASFGEDGEMEMNHLRETTPSSISSIPGNTGTPIEPHNKSILGAISHSLKSALGHLVSPPIRSFTNGITDAHSISPVDTMDQSVIPSSRSTSNPALFAGCTAISVLLVENTLYIANAGDSRAVLCRAGGKAVALSRDHKPALPEEKKRIYAAGGFIEAGRVNGNLSLSRALGDLIYKQDMSLPPEQQIVTGFPEVNKVELMPDDEFLIIGCDGIWEYFSSQDVVDFIRARLTRQEWQVGESCISSYSSGTDYAPKPCVNEHTHTKQHKHMPRVDLSRTLEELFDSLISPSPTLFEYGCDNMTAILVDLRPGGTCDCDCHEGQRAVYHKIFPADRRASTTDSATSAEQAIQNSVPVIPANARDDRILPSSTTNRAKVSADARSPPIFDEEEDIQFLQGFPSINIYPTATKCEPNYLVSLASSESIKDIQQGGRLSVVTPGEELLNDQEISKPLEDVSEHPLISLENGRASEDFEHLRYHEVLSQDEIRQTATESLSCQDEAVQNPKFLGQVTRNKPPQLYVDQDDAAQMDSRSDQQTEEEIVSKTNPPEKYRNSFQSIKMQISPAEFMPASKYDTPPTTIMGTTEDLSGSTQEDELLREASAICNQAAGHLTP